MALPGTISTRPIFGTFFNTDGSLMAGATLTFNQAPQRVDDTTGGAIVYQTPYVITTDASGYASGSFIASDDTDLDVRDWTYSASVAASGMGFTDTFHIRVTESIPASGTSFAAIMTDPASGDHVGGAEFLNDLLDVNTAGAASGYALLYNGTSWVAGAVSASGSFATQAYVDNAVTGLALSSDSRFTDARTPTAHAATHASGGSDPVSPESIGAATAAQGALAASAVQPGALAAVATSGSYNDLSNKPTIPSILVLGAADPVPGGTPSGTLIIRYGS